MTKTAFILTGLLAALAMHVGVAQTGADDKPTTRPGAAERPEGRNSRPNGRDRDNDGDRRDRRDDESDRDRRDGRDGRGDRDGGDERDGRDRRDERGDRERRPPPPPPTDEEWAQTTAFLRDHAPHRLDLFQRFAAADRRKGRDEPNRILQYVQARVHERVTDLQKLREKDPEMFEYAIAQFEAEDAIMAALMEMREARHADDEAALQAAQTRLDEAVERFVARSLDERQARIDRLEEDLVEQRERLARDRERAEELEDRVRERYDRMLPRHLPPPATRPAERGEPGPDDEA